MYNSDHTATGCIGQKKIFLLPPQSVDVLSRFIYTALWLEYYILLYITMVIYFRSTVITIFYTVLQCSDNELKF